MGKIMILSFDEEEEHVVKEILSWIKNKRIETLVTVPERKEIVFPGLKIELQQQRIFCEEREIELSPLEYRLVSYLALSPGQVFSKNQIYRAVYGEIEIEKIDNIIYCLVKGVRNKIETDPQHPQYIQTIRGMGYRFCKQ